jgi:hypothetical protein
MPEMAFTLYLTWFQILSMAVDKVIACVIIEWKAIRYSSRITKI